MRTNRGELVQDHILALIHQLNAGWRAEPIPTRCYCVAPYSEEPFPI